MEITPATLVFGRTVIAAAILLPIALLRVDLRPVLRRWRWVVAFAAVEIAIPWVLLGNAEQHVSSSLAGLVVAGVPLVGTAIAFATGGTDRLGRQGLVGLLIGLVGVGLIVGGDFEASDTTAFLEVGVVVVGYAIGPAILSRRLDGVSSVGVMALSLGLCAVLYAPIAAVQWPTVMPSTNVLVSVVVSRRRLHGRRVRPVRRPDRRDRPRPRDGHHVHQPGGRHGARRVRPRRDVHGRDGDRVRARDPRFDAGDTTVTGDRGTSTAPRGGGSPGARRVGRRDGIARPIRRGYGTSEKAATWRGLTRLKCGRSSV